MAEEIESEAPPPIAPQPRAKRADRSAATIYDIARLAGVNPSTVSRALSKPGRISAKTERRIHDAAKQLNYRVNPMARALPTGRTNTVGVIVADITNPMFFNVIRGAEKAAVQHDYTLVIAESAESADNELRTAERLMRTVDGVILATPRLTDSQIMELTERKPIAVINRQVSSVPGIVADVDSGIAEAVRHLAGLGHRSLVYISGPARSWMSERRWASLRERCEWSNITVTRTDPGQPTLEGGRRAAQAVRGSGATAAIAYNDLVAIGLMQELLVAGLTVPGDLSIIGFDNIFGSDFTTPPLSTIMSPLDEAGVLAFTSILADLDGEDPFASIASKPLVTELVIRGSTGRAKS